MLELLAIHFLYKASFMRNIIIAAMVAAGGITGGANAATVVFVPGVFGSPIGFTLLSDFNTAPAQSIVTGSGFFFPTGDIAGITASIPGNNTPYLSVGGGGTANIGFGGPVRAFSFDYSTVDSYNTLTINYADGGFGSVTGTDIVAAGQANGSMSGSFIVNGDGRLISGIRLDTSSNAFEVDNLSTSANINGVPEPTTWMMLVAGFGLVGAGMRRRTTNAVAA
jgi:hypothetical protein